VRVLHVVAGEKWTGVAAVVCEWTRALRSAGVEAQFAFVGNSPLAGRLGPEGWARPLLTRAHGPAAILADAARLRETVRRECFDLIHAHLTHDHALAALAFRGTPCRLVRTIHHLRHVRRSAPTRALFARTRAFAFGNTEIARASGAPGPVHSPVVDTSIFAPGPKPTTLPGLGRMPASGRFVAGTVGKLARGRGHEEAIAAMAPLGEEAWLLHVGKGERLPALRALADGLGASARNLWAGYQDEALPDFYRAMDVFLFTASGSQQGQRAILEAMATGLPIVALPVPGVRDLLTDGVEGFIAAHVPAATETLRRLAEDPELRARMGEAARRRALDFRGAAFASSAREFYGRVRGA
jgi:glycosyltransferase involved in cell wall biosynthesis